MLLGNHFSFHFIALRYKRTVISLHSFTSIFVPRNSMRTGGLEEWSGKTARSASFQGIGTDQGTREHQLKKLHVKQSICLSALEKYIEGMVLVQ